MAHWVRLLALCFAAFFLASCGGSVGNSGTMTPPPPPPPPPPAGTATAVPAVQHVVIVVLENTDFTDANNPANMPYLNSLLTRGALAANYFADAHPSIPNYFMMTTGAAETFDDSFVGTITDDNVVRELNAAGKSWKTYAESMPAAGFLGQGPAPYARRHVPMTYFSDVQQNSVQAANIVPFTQFSTDIAAGSLPNYSFIIPNLNDDAHDCPGGGSNCAVSVRLAQADQWLRTNVDPLLNSPAFSQSGLLVITFDEASDLDITNGGGHVMTVLVGSNVKAGYTGTATMYEHRSLLRLSLEALGVTAFPNGSGNAADMLEFFHP
jgi:hypothetical protein